MAFDVELPKSVRVGYLDYTIEHWTAQDASSAARYGECATMLQRIRVDTQFGLVRAANTLLHEILHASCNQGSYNSIEHPTEEQTVSQLADVLIQIWQDNPDVMEWISKNARAK